MEVNPLHPIFAAELIGADCTRLTPDLIEMVEGLMAEYGVLCIRGQGHMDDEQHLAFGRAFGPLELPGPKHDGPRRIAYGLYDALPQAMKDRLDGLEAEHSYFHSRRKAGAAIEDSPAAPYMRAVHPMVRTSANGRKTLFVGAHAFRVVGMDDAEGYALIEELLAFAAQPQFIYAHKWQQGDLLIWDNRCTLHRGTEFDYEKYKRDLRRCNVNESGEERSAIPFHVEYGQVTQPTKAN